jgi:thymidylate synthase (FAD)
MQFVEPKAIMLANTEMTVNGLQQFMDELGSSDWKSDSENGAQILTEVCGRACYKSFSLDLNKNLTQIREGNETYISNLLRQKHTSVLEHSSVTFAFTNVSRVFTHELVRHRPGMAYSQESLRFVRLDKLKAWFPQDFQDHPKCDVLHDLVKETFEYLENVQEKLTKLLELNNPDLPFSEKKKLTSACRRLAPIGLATHIIATGNHRIWKHIIQMRTSEHAESEIRQVFDDVAYQLCTNYPHIYQDMIRTTKGEWKLNS